MAETATVGLAGPTALRRPDQLAVGADRFRLRRLIGGHRRLRGDRGPGADSTETAKAASLLARRLPGTGLFRTLYVLPWICAPLAIAVMWRWILAPTDGAISTVLGHRIEWLTDPGLALPVVSAVVVWTNVGYVSLFFLAGLMAIPQDIHNAARTDGASAWQRFWRITLPMLRPTMFFVLVTGIISAAQVFDTVYALTGGGPQGSTDLVAHRIYAEAFGAAAIGRASVMAVVLFVILVGATVVQHLYFRRRISYELT